MAEQSLQATDPGQSPYDKIYEQMELEAANDPSLLGLSMDLEGLAKSLWSFAESVPEADSRFRLFLHDSHHVLEIVGPDRPFLVDSLLGACGARGLPVEGLFHPIVNLSAGSKRSMIQIHLPELTKTECQILSEEIQATLDDVRQATTDYAAMRQKMGQQIEQLSTTAQLDPLLRDEAIAFLDWLGRDHFVFLGVRDYSFQTDADGQVIPAEPHTVEDSSLGVLRDEAQNVLRRGTEPLLLTKEMSSFLSEPSPLVLAKATLESRVHRRVAADYIGVKHFNADGKVVGETRFLGLFTSEAYNESVLNIPLLRQRREDVLGLTQSLRGSHNEKAITNVLEGWPRDELFQSSAEELAPIVQGAANLTGRPRVRLFARRDQFQRFVTAIVFVPREAYDTHLRVQFTQELEKAFGGDLARFEPKFSGPDLVRVMFEISLGKDAKSPDLDLLEARLLDLSRTWQTRFRSAMMEPRADGGVRSKAAFFVTGFTAAYREAFEPETAVKDIDTILDLDPKHQLCVRAYREDGDGDTELRAKIYSRSGSIALSDCVPVFERMGLFVAFESGYPITPQERISEDAPETYWIHALLLRRMDGDPIELDEIKKNFEDAFVAVWSQEAENDGFNALVLNAGLRWREAALFRAMCAYRHQTGMDPARTTQIEALNAHPELVGRLKELFDARFKPDDALSLDDRITQQGICEQAVQDELKLVESLDHDRVLRRLWHMIGATQRTNFFQRDPDGQPLDHISFKIASQGLVDLPAPKPYREIFLSGPTVEGVHCRFGPVARGGLRWSDRRDDFRTEVLGLVKAQQVKNSVIVPVGSKGGFFPKTLPPTASRDERQKIGIEAYKSFISGLLGLTDNLIEGEVKSPKQTVVWDGEDPYLVVAADKGTASFSDIANGISEDLGFWLGDAFASGGSAGYDHKKMGITARGAWEAVKRHFRELGKDIQTTPFTTIGVGDMSGDVFGNGMLLSKETKLLAAFNHLHIFIDPDPQDPHVSWQERKRLFDEPRTSWTDYNPALISRGGGVFERRAKSIALSPEVMALIGTDEDTLTPDELIHRLLQAECELLWFGGIGTYIKASLESDDDADDRGNDSVRIDAKDLNAKVVGEGANLGMTQAARIEFALAGGRLNTDAIDNSAGVDSSDHEVNIKILCSEAIQKGSLQSEARNDLLASMTDDVAAHVLKHNYDQTNTLSLALLTANTDHEAYERLMVELERRERLDRVVETLPDTATMGERKTDNQPLTRPEIAVLMAWSKIVLFDDLVESDVPDAPYFRQTLTDYFPDTLHAYPDAIDSHRLKREIVATMLANRAINLGGPAMFLRAIEDCGASVSQMVTALETASILVNASALQAEIDACDNQLAAASQLQLKYALARGVTTVAMTLIGAGNVSNVAATLEAYGEAFEVFSDDIAPTLNPTNQARLKTAIKTLSELGADSNLSNSLARLTIARNYPTMSRLAAATNANLMQALSGYERIGEEIGVELILSKTESVRAVMGTWERLATRRMNRELRRLQADAARWALESGDVEAWCESRREQLDAVLAQVDRFTQHHVGFAQLALASDVVRDAMADMA